MSMAADAYVPRLVDTRLAEVLAAFPAAMILGPRAVGKTTTARRVAGPVVELDDPAQAAQFRADPSAALQAISARADGPVLLDEWQQVPDVLGAVKRAVDRDPRPGRFVLTGSVRAPLTSASWPGTGRVITVEMYPITVLERRAAAAGHDTSSAFLTRLTGGSPADLALPDRPPDLVGYIDLAVAGGYPQVLGAPEPARNLWIDSYVDQLVLRDAAEVGEVRDPAALRRLLHTLCACTATITADTEVATAAGMNVATTRRYERLLEDLRIVDRLPPWHTNRLHRLVKRPKRFTLDTGLVAALLETDGPGVLANGDLLGRMLETFVLAQLRPLLEVADRRITAHHLRQQDGRREVDVVLETGSGGVIGIEIKATAAPTAADAKHLTWLRDQLGDRFITGIVLHTGRAAFPLTERVTAEPIAALWS